jgi:hypothetical protein
MKLISSTYARLYRIACLLLALHFFNLSIDARDPNPDSIPEDLTFNDIESVTEFVAEVLFGSHNAFEEHDERDSDEGGSLDFYKFYCSNQPVLITQHAFSLPLSPEFYVRNSDNVLAPVKDIHSPPPRG